MSRVVSSFLRTWRAALPGPQPLVEGHHPLHHPPRHEEHQAEQLDPEQHDADDRHGDAEVEREHFDVDRIEQTASRLIRPTSPGHPDVAGEDRAAQHQDRVNADQPLQRGSRPAVSVSGGVMRPRRR